jgi:hypothetical protein
MIPVYQMKHVPPPIEAAFGKAWLARCVKEGHEAALPRKPPTQFSIEVQALAMRDRVRQNEGITRRHLKKLMSLTKKEYSDRAEWLLRAHDSNSGAYLYVEGEGHDALHWSSEKAMKKWKREREQPELWG